MSLSQQSPFKPFIRVTILSSILALLLIYLGINYHWGDYLKSTPELSTELPIPKKIEIDPIVGSSATSNNNFHPEIVNPQNGNALLDSMNKEQIAEHCTNLLSINIEDQVILELATVNCVMSNYQETFQNSKLSGDDLKIYKLKENTLKKQCISNYNQNTQISQIHKELLIGICVSDRMNSSN